MNVKVFLKKIQFFGQFQFGLVWNPLYWVWLPNIETDPNQIFLKIRMNRQFWFNSVIYFGSAQSMLIRTVGSSQKYNILL